jgi:hypothetical protein
MFYSGWIYWTQKCKTDSKSFFTEILIQPLKWKTVTSSGTKRTVITSYIIESKILCLTRADIDGTIVYSAAMWTKVVEYALKIFEMMQSLESIILASSSNLFLEQSYRRNLLNTLPNERRILKTTILTVSLNSCRFLFSILLRSFLVRL